MTEVKKTRKSRARKVPGLEEVWEKAQLLTLGAKIDLIKQLKEAVNIEVKTKQEAAENALAYANSITNG